jgi:cell division protein FtsQ
MAREPKAAPRAPRNVPAQRATQAPAPQRPNPWRMWWRRQRQAARPILVFAMGAAGVGLLAAGVMAADPAARLNQLASALTFGGTGFTVNRILVEGREYTPREVFESALNVTEGDSTLAFNPAAARARLEASAWIASAHVERHLPGTILVRITERRAFAIWQKDGRFQVIDREGRVMQADNIGAFGPLPLVVGAGADTAAANLIDLLRNVPDLAARVEAAVRVSERRWNLRLASGADVLLPEGQEAAAIQRLAELHARERLLDRPLAALDMRLPDRLVLRPQPVAAPSSPTPAPPNRSTRG